MAAERNAVSNARDPLQLVNGTAWAPSATTTPGFTCMVALRTQTLLVLALFAADAFFDGDEAPLLELLAAPLLELVAPLLLELLAAPVLPEPAGLLTISFNSNEYRNVKTAGTSVVRALTMER